MIDETIRQNAKQPTADLSELLEKEVAVATLFQGRVINLQLQTVELPNGVQTTREVVLHPGAVAIMAIKEDGKLLLSQQYRKALNKITLEIPAGKLASGEEPAACAARELQEETGYHSGQLRELFHFYTSPGFSNELLYMFLAEDLQPGEQCCDDDEFIAVQEITVAEGLAMIKAGQIDDGKTIAALLYLAWQRGMDKNVL